jgi:pimeloyl-ACP methyl ester carboxylesterase
VTYAGFGGVAPVEMPWYEKLKADLVNYMITNNLSKVTVIGHSMGGNLALDLAASLPDRIQKLVIVDALACMREVVLPGVHADALGYGGPYIEQMLAMDEAANSSYLDQLTQNMITKPEDQQIVKNWMTGADRETFVYGYVDLLKLDSRPLLPSIKVPVLVMVAGHPYGLGTLDTMKKQYEELERKEFTFAQDSKHYLMLDAKDWFIGEVTSFLAK